MTDPQESVQRQMGGSGMNLSDRTARTEKAKASRTGLTTSFHNTDRRDSQLTPRSVALVPSYDTSIAKQFLQHLLKTRGSLERESEKRDVNCVIHVSKNNQGVAANFRSVEYDHRPRVR